MSFFNLVKFAIQNEVETLCIILLNNLNWIRQIKEEINQENVCYFSFVFILNVGSVSLAVHKIHYIQQLLWLQILTKLSSATLSLISSNYPGRNDLLIV